MQGGLCARGEHIGGILRYLHNECCTQKYMAPTHSMGRNFYSECKNYSSGLGGAFVSGTSIREK